MSEPPREDRPYQKRTCPTCKGERILTFILGVGRTLSKTCATCKGEGIVWIEVRTPKPMNSRD